MIQPPALVASERALFHEHFKYTITHAVHNFFATHTFTFSQAEMIDVRSSPTLLYCFPSAYIVRHKILQRFSLGFRSGEFAGHPITCTPFCKNQSHVFATWMDLQSLLQKVQGGYLADLNQLQSSGLQGTQYSFDLDNQTQPRPLATFLLQGVWKIYSPLSVNRANNRLHHPARLNWISFRH